MKLILKYSAIIITASAISISGCKKKIQDAYLNPNAPSTITVEEALAPIISTMVANSAGSGAINDSRFAGSYVQYWGNSVVSTAANSQSQYDRMGGTSGVSDNAGSQWRAHYYDIGQNCINMIRQAEEQQKWDYAGVGQAIFAWSWLQLTDYHGEVILKDAFNAQLFTFKFDKEEDVYTYVRSLCRQAIANLNKTGGGVSQTNLAKGDAWLYNGDVNKWKKFVYAVMARSFMHLSNKASFKTTLADSVLFYSNLSFSSNADNPYVRFAATGISANSNFFGPFRNNISGLRQGAYIADMMQGRLPVFNGVVDPRSWYILKPGISNIFRGVPVFGGIAGISVVNDRPLNFWGGPSASTVAPVLDTGCTFIFRNAAPMPVMTAAEIQFMRAEAAYRKGDPATALAAYTQGIRLHFDMLINDYPANIKTSREITPAIRDAFLANTSVVPATPAGLTLSHIMMQKYIALFGYGSLETWVDMRRYHYIDADENGNQVYRGFAPPAGTNLFPDNNGKLVYRVRYRYNSEFVWNLDVLKSMGADAIDWHTKETWFSKP
ncbi:MAG: SusD/RagB family nutrient-binding outer membrane lipoprotein [Chitinophagaceae bacterium]|nr:SusD/RagB family nutrient-binding outer membrane lipoprotein [Chitinophagaceae bacterium]